MGEAKKGIIRIEKTKFGKTEYELVEYQNKTGGIDKVFKENFEGREQGRVTIHPNKINKHGVFDKK